MEEIWKDIKEYEGYYQVSNLGRVKSLPRPIIYKNGDKHFSKERILKPSNKRNGYLGVLLYKETERKHVQVHRLVAEAFIPNPDNLPEVNHLNEMKNDNRAINLNWMTHKENINWGTRTERTRKPRKKIPTPFTS